MKLIFALLFLFTFAQIASAVESRTKSQILEDNPDGFYELSVGGLQIIAAIHKEGTRRMPKEQLSLWVERPGGFQLFEKIQSEVGESFDRPQTFESRGFSFVNIRTNPSGSGGFVQELFFWLAPDHTLHPVEFQSASESYENLVGPGKIVQNGGEKEFFIDSEAMKFEFWVANEGDAHCCPSAGLVSGTYKVVGDPAYDFFRRRYTGKIAITVDKLTHEPTQTALISSR